jgi:hypothetical protein
MKYSIIGIYLLVFASFISCTNDKKEVVLDYFESLNNKDVKSLRNCLAPNFKTYFEDSVLYLEDFISFKKLDFGTQNTILKITDEDSLINVRYSYSNPIDTLLNIKHKPEVNTKFYLKDGKINNITSKSDKESFKDFEEEFWKKYNAVIYYFVDHNIIDSTTTKDNINQLIQNNINKYYQEEKEIQNKYLNTSSLRGIFKSNTGLYRTIEFKGASTVVILGFFATSYVVDENYVRIKTDKSDLIFKIKDRNTLEGEGYAEGIYKKE